MRFRTADMNDLHRLMILYKAVAKIEGGIARLEHEVTEEYVKNFLEKSLESGFNGNKKAPTCGERLKCCALA